jgi:hypothetical protein
VFGLVRSLSTLGWLICGLTIVAIQIAPASSAVLKSTLGKDGRVIIQLTGEITEGDTDSFTEAVKKANEAGRFVANVRLNSTGGNLVEGVKLADAIRVGKISTNVGQGAICASACFIVFAAGETKFASYGAQIGVHGASDSEGRETVQSGAATVSMARIVRELGVPTAIIGRMVVTPPSEIVWLSPQELQSMGTTMIGKPVQTSTNTPPVLQGTPQQTTPGEPIDLEASNRASAPPSWDTFVENAVKLSAEQNNGKPFSARVCQPETKTCNNAIIYFSKGTEIMVKVTRDLREAIILREVCSFNKQGDIRLCFDWDSGRKHRDMQDSRGNWTKVADD